MVNEDEPTFARIVLETARARGFKGIVALRGDAGLALRLGSDASQGSLLALLRATEAGELALGELLERWLVVMARPFSWPARIIGSDQMMLSKMYCTRPSITSGADCTPVR